MKVKEFIEKLKKLDGDLEVVVRNYSDGTDYSDTDVEEDSSEGQAAAVVLYFS